MYLESPDRDRRAIKIDRSRGERGDEKREAAFDDKGIESRALTSTFLPSLLPTLLRRVDEVVGRTKIPPISIRFRDGRSYRHEHVVDGTTKRAGEGCRRVSILSCIFRESPSTPRRLPLSHPLSAPLNIADSHFRAADGDDPPLAFRRTALYRGSRASLPFLEPRCSSSHRRAEESRSGIRPTTAPPPPRIRAFIVPGD